MTSILLLLAGLSMAQDDTTHTAPRVAPGGDASAEEPQEGAASEEPENYRDTPPPEVEAGSQRVEYTVKEGETLDDIAMSQGFMPDDLKRWNGVESVKAGDVLVLWAAPVEPEPAAAPEPEPEPEPEKKERGGTDKEGVGFFAGVSVGPAFSLSPLKTAVSPRLELGIELPPMDRSWRIFVSGQYLKPAAIGTANDDRVAGGKFDYDLRQDEFSIAFGPMFRAGMIDGPVKPELAVGPNVYMYRSTVNGSAGGADFPESTEQYTRVGIYGAGGIEWELGPGELTLLLQLASSGLNGVVTGESNSMALSPMLGYRFVF